MLVESCFHFFMGSGAQAYQASKGAISSSDSWAFLAAAMASRKAPKRWMLQHRNAQETCNGLKQQAVPR